ncbi:MAG: DNA-processing protein DprA [Clostridia bacterium]|nr:DNA-processing protein DprA [Clostridia bacterium]
MTDDGACYIHPGRFMSAFDAPDGPELAAWIFWNMAPGVGPATFCRLLQDYGTAQMAARAAAGGGVKPSYVSADGWRWASSFRDPIGQGMKEADTAASAGASIVAVPAAGYPPLLREIFDPPILLYVLGSVGLAGNPWVTVVGSRDATGYGVNMAGSFAGALVRVGIGVASGLARGIDAAAHRGATSHGGPTMGLLGAGIGYNMTSRLRRLVSEVTENGCIASPFPWACPASRLTFRSRNRIMSGVSRACIVVEGTLASGALVTGRLAAEQNRSVYAVPGDINKPTSQAPFSLMAEGATMLLSIWDVLREFGLHPPSEGGRSNGGGHGMPTPRQPAPTHRLDPVESEVYDVIGSGTEFDAVQSSVGMPTSDLLACLSRLELFGLIRREAGMRFSRR